MSDRAVPDPWRRVLVLHRAKQHPLAPRTDGFVAMLDEQIAVWSEAVVALECSDLDAGLVALLDGAFDD